MADDLFPKGYGVIQTGSGGWLDVRQPDLASFTTKDMAMGLARAPRFSGQLSAPYSVAHHSLLVRYLLAPGFTLVEEILALVHDGAEAFLCDMPAPVKKLPEMAGYREVLHKVQCAIERKYDCGAALRERVKAADTLACRFEAYQLLAHRPEYALQPSDRTRDHLDYLLKSSNIERDFTCALERLLLKRADIRGF